MYSWKHGWPIWLRIYWDIFISLTILKSTPTQTSCTNRKCIIIPSNFTQSLKHTNMSNYFRFCLSIIFIYLFAIQKKTTHKRVDLFRAIPNITAERNMFWQRLLTATNRLKTFLYVNSPAFDPSMLCFRPGVNISPEECYSDSFYSEMHLKTRIQKYINCMLQQSWVSVTQHLLKTQ